MISLPKALYIHFLGLFFKCSLMFHDCHYYLAVEEDARGNWYTVVEDVCVEDKADRVKVL